MVVKKIFDKKLKFCYNINTMFVKEGTILILRTPQDFDNDSTVRKNWHGFTKNNVYINNAMLKNFKQIKIPIGCDLKNGFKYNGWTWYDWMFDLTACKNSMFLQVE